MDLWSAIFTVIRRWYVSLPILAIAVVAMFAIGGRIQPDYEAKASIVLNPPVRKIVSGQEQTFRNQYAEDTQTLAAAVYRQINSSDEQRRLEEDGFSPRYEVELDQFSAIMDFTVTGTSPEQALDTANQLIRESERTALAIQRQSQPPEDELVNVDAVSLPVDAELVPGSKTRVMATILLLGLVGAASAAFIVESLVTRRRQGTLGAPPAVDPAYAYAPYPQLPPGVYAPPAAYPGYAPAMPVPAAQPTPTRVPAPAPQTIPAPAPPYVGANGYATSAPTAEPANDDDSQALDSLLAEVDSDEQLAPRRPPEGKIINRGRTASGSEGSDRDRPRLTQPFEAPDAPILVGAGEDVHADERAEGSDEPMAEADSEAQEPTEAEAEAEAELESEPEAAEVEVEPADFSQPRAEVEVDVEAAEAAEPTQAGESNGAGDEIAAVDEPDAEEPATEAAEASASETSPDNAREPEPVPSVLHRGEPSDRRREPGGGRQRGSRSLGAERGNGRSGSNSSSGRGGANSQGSGSGNSGNSGNSGRVRNQGNSRSASRRNRRSLFAAQPEAPASDSGTSSTVPASGVTAEATAPDGD